MKRLLVLGFGIWVSGAGSLHAQAVNDPRDPRVDEWVSAVLRHSPGEVDASVLAIRVWSPADLEFVSDRIDGVLRLEPTAGRDPNQLLRRGAMLHADIAMRAPPRSDSRAGSSGTLEQRSVYLADGRTVGEDTGADHWLMARALLGSIVGDPVRRNRDPRTDPFVRLWYHAVSRFMLLSGKLWWPHFDHARELFPDDPELLFLEGSLHETLAAPRIQDAVAALRASRDRYQVLGVDDERDELRKAESLYREAARLDPAQVEARIRLGRVLTALDRHAEAVAVLKDLPQGASSLLTYYASLFLGRAAHAAGDIPLAVQSYERAADLYPRAQSPRLALSHIAQTSGGRSSRPLNEVLTLPADREREDPWWSYYTSAGRDAAATFDRLHEMLRAGDRR